jgi:hypothetical protein
MTEASVAEGRLFEGEPFPRWIWRLTVPPGEAGIGPRALLAVALAWLPLALLVPAADGREGALAFVRDFGAHSRYLLAAPLLVLAEVVCPRRLAAVIRYFAESGMIDPGDRRAFGSALEQTRRWRESKLAEVLAVALAYGLVFAVAHRLVAAPLPVWHRTHLGAAPGLSWAGWWHLLVSLPLLLVLLLGWAWRWLLWTRMLWRISRCRLLLVAAHPDRAGGLRFVGYSARAFTPIAVALGTMVAGTAANGIVNEGVSPLAYKHVIPAVAGIVAVLSAGPPFLLLGRMLEQWHAGTELYGELAAEVGRTFERHWLRGDAASGPEVLGTPEFSAMTDLYSIVGNVYAMRLAPFDLRSVVLVVLTALVPFVPVALLAIPVDTILSWLLQLFL